MKSSEAKPLTGEELITLKSLLQRWVLVTYPYYGGSSEESDAYTTFDSVQRDADRGRTTEHDEEEKQMIADQGESSL